MKKLSLNICKVLSLLGCIFTVIAGIFLLLTGHFLESLILSPLCFLYSLTMYYVFEAVASYDQMRFESHSTSRVSFQLESSLKDLRIRNERIKLGLAALRQVLVQKTSLLQTRSISTLLCSLQATSIGLWRRF